MYVPTLQHKIQIRLHKCRIPIPQLFGSHCMHISVYSMRTHELRKSILSFYLQYSEAGERKEKRLFRQGNHGTGLE